MRNTVLATITLTALAGMSGALALAQGGAAITVIEQAPKDHVIAIPTEKLAQYIKDMDAKKLTSLRMVEGGKHSVTIRRITSAETPQALPMINVWYVMQGAGTLSTGGKIENGKIVGGESHPIKPGDVEFIPAGLPYGVSAVDKTVTWLNVRWDVDWPANAPLGAGNAPPAPGAAPRGGGRGGLGVIDYAPTDRAIHISKEMLVAYQQDMDAKKSETLRMIEGGHFNVNIRRIHAPSTEFHETTIDTWVVLEGSGTANTGFSTPRGDMYAGNGARVAGSGVDAPAKVEDVFFVPSKFTHGFSAVNGVMSWLNIRWDDNYGK